MTKQIKVLSTILKDNKKKNDHIVFKVADSTYNFLQDKKYTIEMVIHDNSGFLYLCKDGEDIKHAIFNPDIKSTIGDALKTLLVE